MMDYGLWPTRANRITASSNPQARDWKIIEDVGKKELSEAQEKSRQRQSVLLLGQTREEAERTLWRVRNVNRHSAKKWRLEVFTGGRYGWQPAPEREAAEVSGINPEWDRGTALTLVKLAEAREAS